MIRGIAVIITIVAAIGAVAGAREYWSPSSSIASPPAAAPAGRTRWTPATLATTPVQGWQELDAPGMVGRYESFDVVANISWARGIAAAWKPDAVLYRLSASRVAKDGTANLVMTPDASAEYRFSSPKCVTDYKKSTALIDPRSECDLFLMIKSRDHEVRVEVTTASAPGGEQSLEGEPSCSLAAAFAALDAAGKLPARPVYDVDLHTWSVDLEGRRHPAWIFSTIISGQAHIPVVDPTSCAVGR